MSLYFWNRLYIRTKNNEQLIIMKYIYFVHDVIYVLFSAMDPGASLVVGTEVAELSKTTATTANSNTLAR